MVFAGPVATNRLHERSDGEARSPRVGTFSLAPARVGGSDLARQAALFGALALLPDLDLLVGVHRGPTHGVGAALIVGLILGLVTTRIRLGVVGAAAYGSHTLLDWLGGDSSAPIGLMALWPFSSEYYASDLHLFYAISRRFSSPDFWHQNLRAVGWELVLLGPPAALGWLLRSRRRSPPAGPTEGRS